MPEWGNELTKSSAKWPWDMFTSDGVWLGNAKVKLNWQAKLMPVTQEPAQAGRRGRRSSSQPTWPKISASRSLPVFPFDKMVTH